MKTKAEELKELGEGREERRKAVKQIRALLNGEAICLVTNMLIEERPLSIMEELSKYNGKGQAALVGLDTFLSSYIHPMFPWSYVRKAMEIGAKEGPAAVKKYAKEVKMPRY